MARGIGSLLVGTHLVTVSRSGGGYVVTVYLDGVRVLAQAETGLPSSVRLAFTAGTGTLTDAHVVQEWRSRPADEGRPR